MLAEVRQAIADAISSRLPQMQVSPYILAAPTPPAAHVFPSAVDYDQAMARGADTWMFTLQAFVGAISDIGSQVLLDKMLEPSGDVSIKEAVEADMTLGGLAWEGGCRVKSFTGYRQVVLENTGGLVLVAEWQIEVRADGG
jgi:hypothetical protein